MYGRGKSMRRGSITGFIGKGREREWRLGQSTINSRGGASGGGGFNSKTRKRGNGRGGLRLRGGVGLHCSLNARMKEGGRREDWEMTGGGVAVRGGGGEPKEGENPDGGAQLAGERRVGRRKWAGGGVWVGRGGGPRGESKPVG
jgi:hypothetical protein